MLEVVSEILLLAASSDHEVLSGGLEFSPRSGVN